VVAVRTNGSSPLWDRYIPPPSVAFRADHWGADFQEITYGAAGGTWDVVCSCLHIAQLVTPAHHIGRGGTAIVVPSAAVKVPGQRIVGGWRGLMLGRHVFVSPAQFQALVGEEFRPDHLPTFTFARQGEPPRTDRSIEHMLAALSLDLRDGSPGGSLFAQTALAAILHRLIGPRPSWNGRGAGLEACDRAIARVIERIQADLAQRLTLVDLAAEIGVSVQYLCRAFRQATGLSPHQYVIRERVRLAHELIARTDLSLSQIARNCGFTDQAQMATTFRKVAGTSPSKIPRSPRGSGRPSGGR
jgi:AraC-like DNA-binding protein